VNKPQNRKMKAAIINEFGGRDKIQIVDLPIPEPNDGEVLVKIKAAGINPVDFKIREGYLKERMPCQFPIILGWDFAGVVEKNGFGAHRFKAGDEVFAYARRSKIQFGTYSEYITLPESFITYKPKSISFEEAAAVPLAALTAYQSIVQKGGLRPNENVLIIGATGGVGSFAVQIAGILGANVVAVSSGVNKMYALGLGAKYFIDYSKGDVTTQIEENFPDKFDLVFDCTGKEYQLSAYQYLKPGGRLVSILNQANPALVDRFQVQFHYVFVEPNVLQLNQLAEWIDAKKLKVHIEEIFSLENVKRAHEKIESQHTRGKLILSIY